MMFSSPTKLKRLLRYFKIYGLFRTIVKAIGRTNFYFRLDIILKLVPKKYGRAKILMIGGGHHAFSALAFFLLRHTKSEITALYDPDSLALQKFKRVFGVQNFLNDGFVNDDQLAKIDYVYIVSNHASHFDYAKYYLQKNKKVFVEKPLCLSKKELIDLNKEVQKSSADIYVGYNRPLAPAIQKIIKTFGNEDGPFTYVASIIGHVLASDHWYRNQAEGSRIVSNLGHWIDLYVHLLLQKKELPSELKLTLVTADEQGLSDNMQITIVSDLGDLAVLTFSCRGEPFEGVSEVLVLQRGDLISKIYDFRRSETWLKDSYNSESFKGKRCGHEEATLQPFKKKYRKWFEIYLSTWLMLSVEEMFQSKQGNIQVTFSEIKNSFENHEFKRDMLDDV